MLRPKNECTSLLQSPTAPAFPLQSTMMSDRQDEVPASSPAQAGARPSSQETSRDPTRRRRWALAALVVLAAIAIAAAWVDSYNRNRDLRIEVAQRFADIDADDKAQRASVQSLQDSLGDAQAKIALLENRLAESQSQQAALEGLYRELA